MRMKTKWFCLLLLLVLGIQAQAGKHVARPYQEATPGKSQSNDLSFLKKTSGWRDGTVKLIIASSQGKPSRSEMVPVKYSTETRLALVTDPNTKLTHVTPWGPDLPDAFFISNGSDLILFMSRFIGIVWGKSLFSAAGTNEDVLTSFVSEFDAKRMTEIIQANEKQIGLLDVPSIGGRLAGFEGRRKGLPALIPSDVTDGILRLDLRIPGDPQSSQFKADSNVSLWIDLAAAKVVRDIDGPSAVDFTGPAPTK